MLQHHHQLLSVIFLAGSAFSQVTFSNSAKCGLPFVPSPQFPQDDQIWVEPGSDLTWYYNYMWAPSPEFSIIAQSHFEYVPMIWGAPANDDDWNFLNNVADMIKEGRNISHILGFNESDGPWSQAGSNMSVSSAVDAWTREIEPLKKLGVKLGAPAVTQRGQDWLAQFMAACLNCTIDFIPLHYYGNLSGFQDLVNTIHTRYPNIKLWITEFGYDHVALQPTQEFFNDTTQFLDDADYIERYSWFGAFRSNASNVGPNGCMLTQDGKLTDIGSWYLGGAATNNVPSVASKIYGVGTDIWVVVILVMVMNLLWLMV